MELRTVWEVLNEPNIRSLRLLRAAACAHCSGVKRILAPIAVAFSLLFTGCETTLDYGYYVNGFDEDAIQTLFAISDESASNLDLPTYSGLFGPNFTSIDETDGLRSYVSRADYLEMVEDIFDTSSFVRVQTAIMDIEFVEPGRRAIVKTQEEEMRKQGSDTKHYTSLIDYTVGYEDGWIFFERSQRTAIQVIDE